MSDKATQTLHHVTDLAQGPEITRQVAYGPNVTRKYGLRPYWFERTSLRRRLMARESRQLVADDITSEIWLSTGKIVHL